MVSEPERLIYGGTFDPPHTGHSALVSRVLERFPKSRMEVTVSPAPAGAYGQHKTPDADFQQRLAMCRLAFDDERVHINAIEATLPTPNFTWQTLDALGKPDAGSRWALVMGRDQFQSLPGWKRARELVRRCDLIVVDRDSSRDWAGILEQLESSLGRLEALAQKDCYRWVDAESKVYLLRGDIKPAASHQIREDLAQALASGWIAPRIAEYIKDKRLYERSET